MSFFSCIKHIFSKTEQVQDINSLAFINSPVAAFISDEKGRFVEVNNSFTKLTGYTNKDVTGEFLSILKSGKHNNQFYKNLWLKALEMDSYSFEIYNKCKNAHIILMKENVAKIKHNAKTYFLVTQEDITEKKKLEDRQQYLATHDPLTNLANRTLLKDRFSQAVFHAKRKHKKIAIFLCDLNEFKDVNDTHGHNFGDNVLKAVADNLRHIIREGDTVARYGGDEFVIIVEQLKTDNEIKTVLKEIQEKSTVDVEDGESICSMSMSIGHAIFPSDGLEFDQLINLADSRMYDSKKEYYGY